MLLLSPLLTLLAIVVIGILVFVTKKIGGNSGKYFVRQQISLADVTGFVEEHMNGQRVVKVFNHEQKSRKNSTSSTNHCLTVPHRQTNTQT